MSSSEARAMRSGRYVPSPVLEHIYVSIPGNFEEFKRHFDNHVRYQAAVGQHPPKLMAQQGWIPVV